MIDLEDVGSSELQSYLRYVNADTDYDRHYLNEISNELERRGNPQAK